MRLMVYNIGECRTLFGGFLAYTLACLAAHDWRCPFNMILYDAKKEKMLGAMPAMEHKTTYGDNNSSSRRLTGKLSPADVDYPLLLHHVAVPAHAPHGASNLGMETTATKCHPNEAVQNTSVPWDTQ